MDWAAFEEAPTEGNARRFLREARLAHLRRERIERVRLVKALWMDAMLRREFLQWEERVRRIAPHSVVDPCIPFQKGAPSIRGRGLGGCHERNKGNGS